MQGEPAVQEVRDEPGECRWCGEDDVEFGWYAAVLGRVLDGADRRVRLAATCRGTGDRPLLTHLASRVCHDGIDPRQGVLDVGSGFGGPAAWLRGALRSGVVGVEPSADAVRLSRRLFPEVPVLRADAAHLPLAASSVNAAFLLGVLSLVPNSAAVLAELRRVVRPGGALAVTDYVTADRWTARTADLPSGNHPDPAGSLAVALAATGWTPSGVVVGEAAQDDQWSGVRTEVEDAVDRHVASTPHGVDDACPVALAREREALARMRTAIGDGTLQRLTFVAR